MSRETLAPSDLYDAMSAFRSVLQRHQATINRLNVFPVPDGDTGTNMLLTLESVCAELAGIDESPTRMESVCAAVARGSLMGARGNSGVILCQVLRAFTSAVTELDQIGPTDVASTLTEAADAARSAVSRPVEGTILTVVSGAAIAASAAADSGSDLAGVLSAAHRGALRALESTPSLLPVLAEAGVVDAGGAGLVLLFCALEHVAGDVPMPEELELPADVAASIAESEPSSPLSIPSGADGEGPRYEVMYLLDAEDGAVPALRARFDEIGDSTVIVGSAPMFSCHVHTDDVGGAIEAGVEAGRPHEIRVTDLREQVEEERWVREAVTGADEPAPRAAPPVTSVVAVATGAGIRRIFTSLGVARLVSGGQSMNPSTADVLDMTESAPGPEVVLLPNNKNIIPVAEQVKELSTKRVYIVATLGVQEGLAALLAYDPGATGEENAASMGSAASHVVAGEVTQAVRASSAPVGAIRQGDWLGIGRAGIEVVEHSFVAASCALIEQLLEPSHEIVTLIEGNAADAAAIGEIETWIAKHHPELAVELHLGGQPLYPLLVSIE